MDQKEEAALLLQRAFDVLKEEQDALRPLSDRYCRLGAAAESLRDAAGMLGIKVPNRRVIKSVRRLP